jgi:hypothetical protein
LGDTPSVANDTPGRDCGAPNGLDRPPNNCSGAVRVVVEAAIETDPFTLPSIGPAPQGSIEAIVRCRTSRTGGTRNKHAIGIDADWSVTTPHDLALERIAAAMGGYLSCLDLVDRYIPALRELTQREARRVLPQITRNSGGRWTFATLPTGCTCESFGFASASEAAGHLRGVWHVAHEYGVPPRDLERLMNPIFGAHDTLFFAPPTDEWNARATVREDRGVDQLWDAGLHPQTVAAIHRAVWPGGPPLPMWFYLGAMSRRPNLGWLAQTLQAVPDENLAVWLCWTNAELDHVHPEARTGWLQAGVPRQAIAALADGSYSPIDVARVSHATGRSLAAAALTLAAWQRAGCHPRPEDIVLLDELDVDPWYEPSVGAIDWLWNRVGRRGGPSRTGIGLVLAVCGTRAGAMKAFTQGIHDPRGAARLMGIAVPDHTSDQHPASEERRLAHQ